jgi:hypothetical protein
MNRQQRRAQEKRERQALVQAINEGRAIDIGIGHLQPEDPNYGLPINCDVCGREHKALGLAQITDREGTHFIPLCQPCVEAPDKTSQAITKRYFQAPEMEFSDGGDIANMVAMEEKRGVTEH